MSVSTEVKESTAAPTLKGKVVSDVRDKTRTVEVYWSRRHDTYSKVIQRKTKYHVHDSENVSKMGDWIEFRQCKPMSKTKSSELVCVVEESKS